jgi:hypothetical protein
MYLVRISADLYAADVVYLKIEHVQYQRRISQVIIFRPYGVQELSSKGEVVDVGRRLGQVAVLAAPLPTPNN